MANPDRVVCNHRFPSLPSVRVHRLASRVLRLATDRIADDWERRYGVRPALVCTFTGVDGGWSWRAARWRRCPEPTSGRRSGIRRAVWPSRWNRTGAGRCAASRVVRRAGPIRCPARASGPMPNGPGASTQAACTRTDGPGGVRGRWGKRGGSVPAGRFRRSCPARRNSGRPIACCRTPGSGWNILAGHTAGRHAGAAAPGGSFPRPGHDDADCDGLAATGGPGSPGGGGKGGRGLPAHVGMAVTAAGRPLGMFPWTRTSAGSVKGTAPAGRRVPAGQWSWTRPAPEPGWFPCATGRAISGSFRPAPGTDRRRSRCGPANPQGAASSRGTGKSGTCGGVSDRPRRWAGGSSKPRNAAAPTGGPGARSG